MECNDNNLSKLPNYIKQATYVEETDNSDKVMKCINTILSTSSTLKNFVVNKFLHSSYIQTELKDEKEMITIIFSADGATLLKDINHPALLQERKLNLDAASYEKKY